MDTWVALLRGVNVGGKNILPMKELARGLEKLGFADVRTYIQSGNVVFRGSETAPSVLADKIADSINSARGFRPGVLVMRFNEFVTAAEANPFPQAESDANKMHLFFLATVPSDPDLAALDAVKLNSERYVLRNRVLYLYAPDGIGRSKFAARAEKLIGVDCTVRNLRSVSRIIELVQ